MKDTPSILKKNLYLKSINSGQRCFIIGNGPSIKKQNLLSLNKEIKIASNAFHHHEHINKINPQYWICADPNIWVQEEHFLIPLFKTIEQKGINTNLFFPISAADKIGESPIARVLNINIHFFLYDVSKGITEDIDFAKGILPFGQNVALVSLMLALYLGCNPIYLIGCDHTWWGWTREEYKDLDTPHFYNTPNSFLPTSQILSFDNLQTTIYVQKYQYLQLIKYAEKRGIQIFNATNGGYLDLFPRVNYEDLFPYSIRSVDSKEILSVRSNISLELGKSAIKLINDGEYSSAFVLIEAAISKNLGEKIRTEGLNYLKAVCLMGLGEHREAIKTARQECICNSSNQDKTVALLRALGDEEFIQGMFSDL